MLQLDHVYEFFYRTIFSGKEVWYCPNGVVVPTATNIQVFTPKNRANIKIFCYDQEPFILEMARPYMYWFTVDPGKLILMTSEYSDLVNQYTKSQSFYSMYYFFHGFAALDWYRGYYALNYDQPVIKEYQYDYITFNRLIHNDRSYRIYLISKLKEQQLSDRGLISFSVADDNDKSWRDEITDPNSKLSAHAKKHADQYLGDVDKLIIDGSKLSGSVSADIPRNLDALWHIVTETVFYYNKLHLTEKIFKPIVSKQPFMLLAAPGNLAYLRSYGFKTFDGIIDESYDTIQDNDARIDAVVKQLAWYCGLSAKEKQDVICALEPIIEHNFRHFYGEFRHIITQELLGNAKTLFKEIEYDDSHINYNDIYHALTH